MRRIFVVAMTLSVACAHDYVGPVRFYEQEIVTRVDDRQPIAEPEAYDETLMPYYLDAFMVRRFTRWTEMHNEVRAKNINALDEVPDSTWFINRIAVRDVSPEEIKRGPGDGTNPELSKPWTVTRMKVGGTSVGFIIKDAKGEQFLLKFDTKGYPELETSADVIVQRLFWALGYNVPDDEVASFTRDELRLAADAKKRDPFGKDQPLTDADIDENLQLVDRAPDGRYRALVSSFLPGKILGGFKVEGKRDDDPNDTVPHQHRREVRATRLFYAWVQDVDVKQTNTLDVWVHDPADPAIRYIRHYFVDFGKSLGAWRDELRMGYEGWGHVADFSLMAKSMISLGFWPRPWEKSLYPNLRGVGWFESKQFDPDAFEPAYPYYPHSQMDAVDAFWAAKLIMRFTPEQIRAAVEAGHYSDAHATDYVVRTLIERQRKIGALWFKRVTPLDGFRFSADGDQLCFDDLLVRYGLANGASTYRARAFDTRGKATGWSTEATRSARNDIVCIRDVALADDGYTMIEIDVHRNDPRDGEHLKPILVHVSPNDAGEPRIIGLRRNHGD